MGGGARARFYCKWNTFHFVQRSRGRWEIRGSDDTRRDLPVAMEALVDRFRESAQTRKSSYFFSKRNIFTHNLFIEDFEISKNRRRIYRGM